MEDNRGHPDNREKITVDTHPSDNSGHPPDPPLRTVDTHSTPHDICHPKLLTSGTAAQNAIPRH